MAFTDTPSNNVEQNKKINLFATSHARRPTTSDVDYAMVNGVFEIEKNSALQDTFRGVFKRDGCVSFIAHNTGDTFLGWYYWSKWNVVLLFFGNTVYIYSASTGTQITSNTLTYSNSSGQLGFTEYLYDSGAVSLIVTNGTILTEITTSNGTSFSSAVGADPDMPVPHAITPVFLNGYLFLVKTGTADIYNSDLNTPLVYTAGDFISAESLPDGVTSIARINFYIAAFGSGSIELFYDAAGTASPLRKYDISVRKVGLLGGLCEYENQLIFVGKSANTPPKIYMMEDLKLNEINDPVIVRWLSEVTDSTFTASIVSHTGHTFYVLTANGQTWQYDLEFKTWSKLKFGTSSTFAANASWVGAGQYSSMFTLSGNPTIYKTSRTVYTDAVGTPATGYVTTSYSFSLLTDKENFNTYRPKFGHRLCVFCDSQNTDNIEIRWTDDDYTSFSAYRTIAMNQAGRYTHRLGKFIDRAWQITYTGTQALRIYSLELDYSLGTR